MSIAVICPRCQAHFGITDDLADEPVACPKCTNVFSRAGSAGIHAGTPPKVPKTAPAKNDRDDDEPMPPSRPHASPRVPFPTAPLLVLLCGVLFLLLALSVGFNVWIVFVDPRQGGRAEAQIMRAQAMQEAARAAEMRDMAEQNAKRAADNQQKAQQQEAKMKRDLDDLRRELEAVRLQLDDAKRKLEKEK